MLNRMSADSENWVYSTLRKSSDIVFLSDIFSSHTSRSENKNESLFNMCLQSWSSKLLSIRRYKSSKYSMTFQSMWEQSLVHSLFCRHFESSKADNITSLNHWIARHRETTLSFKELPHWIKLSKNHQLLTSEEQMKELTCEKSFLLQKLIYHKETWAAEMRFIKKVTELCAELKTVLTEFDCDLQKRLRDWTQAESDLCSYWGIESDNENVKNYF